MTSARDHADGEQTCLWASAILTLELAHSGSGRHWATLTDHERTDVQFWYAVWTVPAILGLGLPKMAVVSLLCRLFKPLRYQKVILWILAILCVLNFGIVSVLDFLRCEPRRALWEVTLTDAKCLDPWIYINFCYYPTCKPSK